MILNSNLSICKLQWSVEDYFKDYFFNSLLKGFQCTINVKEYNTGSKYIGSTSQSSKLISNSKRWNENFKKDFSTSRDIEKGHEEEENNEPSRTAFKHRRKRKLRKPSPRSSSIRNRHRSIQPDLSEPTLSSKQIPERQSDYRKKTNPKTRNFKSTYGKLPVVPKVATCCFALCYVTLLASASPMPPRLRKEHVARYINFTRTMGKEPLPTTFLTTTELIAARSLVPEEHYIISEDGYILSLYRLYDKKTMNRNKPPVLIMHGLLASSDSWLVGKRSTSLPLFLADLGYDVWLGDQRGNANSKRHVYLNPRSQAFWNFSFHECGYYDLPTFVDHILGQTGHKQLIYIGHSMATSAFLVMSTTKPQYNSKIKLACLMAPVAHLKNKSELEAILLYLFSQADFLFRSLQQIGLHEILPRTTTYMQLTKIFCGSMITQPLCVLAVQMFFQQNPKNIDMERAGFIYSYMPAGSSLKMLEHFAQSMNSGRFQYYDYGPKDNLNIYNSEKPPIYDIRKANASIALYYSLNDIFLNHRTVMKTVKELPKMVHLYEIPDKRYSHADYVLGLNSKEVLFKDLLKLMMKYD